MKKMLAILVAFAGLLAFAKDFSPLTVAFYPFTDGAPGTSAVGVALKNLIDGSTFPGRVEKTGTGDVQFSDERPARYLFEGNGYGDEPVYENMGSLYFPNSGTEENHAKVFFDGLIKRLNKARQDRGYLNNAWRVEFFYKADTGLVTSSASLDNARRTFVTFQNLVDTSTYTNCDLRLLFYDNRSQGGKYRYGYQVYGYSKSTGARGSFGSKYPALDSTGDLNLKDGKWHYVCITSGYNSYPFAGAPEYSNATSGGMRWDSTFTNSGITYPLRTGDDSNFPLILNDGGNFRGWIAGLKVTTGNAESLVGLVNYSYKLMPSEFATCLPRTISHIRLEDGVKGNELATTLNSSASADDISPNMSHCSLVPTEYGGPKFGQMWRYQATGASATYADNVAKAFIADGYVKDLQKLQKNTLSAKLVPNEPASASEHVLGAGFKFPSGNHPQFGNLEPLTWEFFYRFDYETWRDRVQGATAAGKRAALWWSTYFNVDDSTDTYPYNSALMLDWSEAAAPILRFYGYSGNSSWSSDKLTDGMWHHVAITINPSASGENTAAVKVYFDRALVISCTANHQNADTFQANRNFFFGRGIYKPANGAHGMAGWMDEMRVSWGLLTPDEFLRARTGGGLILFVR